MISGSLAEPFLYLLFVLIPVRILSDNLLIIESFMQMAYNISNLTRGSEPTPCWRVAVF
ncbi:hypothetical protein FGY90_05650 [Escherichia coli]|nr:hypothetical protein [Escherichia coli]